MSRVLSLESFIVAISGFFGGNLYLGIYLLVLSTAVLPIAPPEEAITLLAGACLSTGVLRPAPAGIIIILAIISVNSLQYGFGRLIMRALLHTRWSKRISSSPFLLKGEQEMRNRGWWAIIFCRFMFGTRTPVYLAAGFLRYPYFRFLLIDGAMVCIHAVVFMVIGWIFAHQINQLIEFFSEFSIITGIVFGTVLVVLTYLKIRQLKA